MEVICINCGKVFSKKPSEAKRTKIAHFCSWECFQEYISKHHLRRKITAKLEKLIVESFDAGMRPPQIAEKIGASSRQVREILREHNRVMHKPGEKLITNPTVKIPHEEVEVGYLAALIDGEGTIKIRGGKKERNPSVTIFNTSEELVKRLLAKWGGNFYTKKHAKKRLKDLYIWGAYRAIDVYLVLKTVYPHLIVKKDLAKKALDALEQLFKHHGYQRVVQEIEQKARK